MDESFAGTHWSRVQCLEQDPDEEPGAAGQREGAWEYIWRRFRPAMLRTVRTALVRMGGGSRADEDEVEDAPEPEDAREPEPG